MENVHVIQPEGLPYIEKSFRELKIYDHIIVQLGIGLEVIERFAPGKVFFTAIDVEGRPLMNRSNPMPITNDRLAICSVFTNDSLIWVYYDDVLESYLLVEALIDSIGLHEDQAYCTVRHIIPLRHVPQFDIHLAAVAAHAIRYIDQASMVPFNLQEGYRAHMKVMFSEGDHFCQKTDTDIFKTVNQNVHNVPYTVGTYIYQPNPKQLELVSNAPLKRQHNDGLLIPFQTISMEHVTQDRRLLDKIIQFTDEFKHELSWISPKGRTPFLGSVSHDLFLVLVECADRMMLVPIGDDQVRLVGFTSRAFLLKEFRELMLSPVQRDSYMNRLSEAEVVYDPHATI